MIKFDTINEIHLYTGPTSMKMGILKIQQLVSFVKISIIFIIHKLYLFSYRIITYMPI